MPVSVSYPGVYIQEIPSGVHTITGVATSITAFVGLAARASTPVAAADLFDLTVQDLSTGATEVYHNLTLVKSLNQADVVLKNQSALVTWGSAALIGSATPAWFSGATFPVYDDAGKAQNQL